MSGNISESEQQGKTDEGEPEGEPQEQSLSEALEAAYDKSVGEESTTPEEKPEGESEGEVKTEEAKPKAESEDEPKGKSEEGAEGEVVPPKHWSDEDKQAFVKMDEVGRNLALRMETNFHKGIQEKSEELKKFRDVVEPYKPHFGGKDETEVVRNLLAAQAFIISNPVEGLKRLAQNLKVDLKTLVPSETPSQDDTFVDPEISKLQAEIKALKDENEQKAQQAVQTQQAEQMATIAQFRDEADDQGNPKHPHFGAVYSVMAGLLQSGRATDLEDAYSQAVWAVPEYRDEVIQKRAEETAREQVDKRAKEAEEEKRKSTSVQGRKSAQKPSEPASLQSALSEAYDKSIRGEL